MVDGWLEELDGWEGGWMERWQGGCITGGAVSSTV
jgi:hypothetical protein